MDKIRIVIQHEDFAVADELSWLRTHTAGIGAMVSFVGLVRDHCAAGAVDSLWLEHCPGMTERSIRSFVEEAATRWSLSGVSVIHRIGQLLPDEQIVLVLVATPHRADAFQACSFLMDALKTRALFWKKEWSAGKGCWLEFSETDQQAADRWS